MYISLFKSEIGSKLRPKSAFQPPLFLYRYGHSFILFVIGCISAEIVGTLNFFLFIRIREIGRETVRYEEFSSTLQLKNNFPDSFADDSVLSLPASGRGRVGQ